MDAIVSERQAPLRAAVEALYQVFERYPLVPGMQGCPCCVSTHDIARLCTPPLHDLPATDCRRYAVKAMTTWGDATDFKYFLPRLFELLAFRLDPTKHAEKLDVDPTMVLRRLRDASWLTWPADECAAVERYLWALWRTALQTKPACWEQGDLLGCQSDIGYWLDGIARVVVDVQPFLHESQRDASRGARRHLLGFIQEQAWQSSKQRRRRRSAGRPWPTDFDQINAWLRAEETEAYFTDAYFARPDAPDARELAAIADGLRALQS